MTFDEYWQALDDSGWLAEVPSDEVERLRRDLTEQFAKAGGTEPDDAYLWLSVTSFDPECIDSYTDDFSPYVSIIEQLAAHSFGKFTPTGITDTEVKGKRMQRIEFRFGGSNWVVRVPFEDDWFQDKVLDLMNAALRQAEVAQRFLILPPVDQRAFVAFISPETYNRAVEQGLIPGDYEQEDE